MRSLKTFSLVVAVGAFMGAAGCGGPGAFGLAADDNSKEQLVPALAQRKLPVGPQPKNRLGTPLVVLASSSPKVIAAYDLANKKLLWKQDALAESRIVIGGDFCIAKEGSAFVARDIGTGQQRWKASLDGQLVGIAANRDTALIVTKTGSDRPTWKIAAFDAVKGGQLWAMSTSSALGAPALSGDVALVPFLSQWLNLMNPRTGAPLVRLRGVDEQIAVLRTPSDAAFYGSRKGMIRLDDKAATGKSTESTYVSMKFPNQLVRAGWGTDIYSETEVAYSAADRTKIVWHAAGSGAVTFEHAAVHYYRYVLDYSANGDLRWIYNHPRVELVASEHTGKSIVAVSVNGQLVALDPNNGEVTQRTELGLGNVSLIGATFDADGWQASGLNEQANLQDSLIAIAKDRDARFDPIKELAVAHLAKSRGPETTLALLAILAEPRASAKLKDQVVDELVRRKEVESLPALATTLDVRSDYITGVEASALGPVAKAIASLRGQKIDPQAAEPAVAALSRHLEDPATAMADLPLVIDALGAIGGAVQIPVLKAHLIAYRAEPEMCTYEPWRLAIVAGVSAGGPAEKELLKSLANDKRTHPELAAQITAFLRKK